MTYARRATYGIFKSYTRNAPESELMEADFLDRDQAHQEEKMTMKRPLIDRIKVLFRGHRNDQKVAASKLWSCEVGKLASPVQRIARQSSLPMLCVPNSGASVAALLVSGRADRLWLASQERRREAGQTPSNLG